MTQSSFTSSSWTGAQRPTWLPDAGLGARLLKRPMCAMLALAVMLTSAQAATGDADTAGAIVQPTITALMKLFVVALLLESGLAVIFNWRVYLTLCDGRGWKTVIMIATSWFLVTAIPIPWLAQLLREYGGQVQDSDLSVRVLTALVLAGGSTGIYNLLLRFGYRAPVSVETVRPKPPRDKAWLAITFKRELARGPIEVRLQVVDPQPAALPLPIAGVVGAGGWAVEVWGLFFRNRMRFPRSAGYEVDPGVAYQLEVRAVGASGVVPCPLDGVYVFTPGAIVDLTMTL